MLNPKDKRMRLVLMMLLLFAGGIAGCSHQSAESAEGAGKSADTATPVTLIRVTRADIHRTVTVTGSIAALPNQDVRVSSFVAGRIAELKVAEGDHVRSGQIVARLEDHTLRDQLKQAEATVAQARANLENAKLSRTRNETLFQRASLPVKILRTLGRRRASRRQAFSKRRLLCPWQISRLAGR